jgi:hypothetical protein
MRREMAEGLRYVLGHRLLRPIAACTATANLFNAVVYAVVILYMVRQLGLRPAAIGLVFAAGNVGFLAGAIVSGRLAARTGIGRAIVVGEAVGALGALAIPLAPRQAAVPLLVAGMAVSTFGGTVYNVNQVSLRQAITPARLHGRMNATMRFMVGDAAAGVAARRRARHGHRAAPHPVGRRRRRPGRGPAGGAVAGALPGRHRRRHAGPPGGSSLAPGPPGPPGGMSPPDPDRAAAAP